MTPEEQKAHIDGILSDPKNEEKYPDLFKQARELGVLKQDKSDPVLSVIQSRFGNAYSSTEDFFAEYEKLKNGGAEVSFLKTLPEPILDAIDKFTKNQDWTSVFSKGVDYSKNYSDDELLSLYYPNKFTQEEISDVENVAVKSARKAAKEAFLIEKQEKATAKKLEAERKEQFVRKQKESLENTVADWKKKILLQNPKIDTNKLAQMESRIRTELSTGAFYKKFINEDGTFSTESASNLYPLTFMSEFTGAWKDIGRMEGEKTAHTILNNGGSTRQFNRTPAAPQKQEAMFDIKEKAPFKLEPVKS